MAAMSAFTVSADSIPEALHRPLQWRVGIEASPAFVPGTNIYLRGINSEQKRINTSLSGAVRADFSFNAASREGMLYHGLYQGLGVEMRSFMASRLLGTPVSLYAYQGAPIVHFSPRLWLGYEWRFGAAFGWKHYQEGGNEDNAAVSTAVTAHMGLSLKLHYRLSDRWQASIGVDGTHFSNGNTSYPNAGVNTIGASVGLAYIINPVERYIKPTEAMAAEADRQEWFYDIMAYGAWRKRGSQGQVCPGRFGVAGLQFAPMRKFNRYVAAGAALNLQYDEGGGIDQYWVEGSSGDDIKFYRPPFGKQISVGLSAHAELTMPIFAINAGLGYDVVSPKGNKRFYQSLTLKTFVTRRLYINVGYRLGRFKDPQNLMLGLGLRL